MGTVIQIIPVDVNGVSYFVALYYTQDSAVLYNDGGSSWIGGYTGIEYMSVIDPQGSVVRQQSDTWRKALFTAMASHIMQNGENYWVEVLKQIDKLYVFADETYDNDSAYINGQIDHITHMRLLCKIGSFISGLGASGVGGAAVAGKALAEMSFKKTLYTYVMPWVVNEIVQSTVPRGSEAILENTVASDDLMLDFERFSDVGSLEEAQARYEQLLSQGSDDRVVITIALFIAFTAADILIKYFDSAYEADLAELNANANLVLPPLQRMKGYLKSNTNSGYNVGRIIYDKLCKFKAQKPSYAKICDVLGWGIDDPFGIVSGDLSSVFFNYYSAGITENIAYLDGLNTIDGNNTFLPQKLVSQGIYNTLNTMQNRYFLMKGSIYFDSYSLGLLGLEKMNQIDTGNFYQNGYAMTIDIPDNTSSSPIPLGVTVFFDGAPVTVANVVWTIEGTGILGSMLHQGNGIYLDAANITSLLGQNEPALYRINFTAYIDGFEISGFTFFHILPLGDDIVYYALPNPYAMNPEELAFHAYLESNYASVILLSLNDLSYNAISADDYPLLIFFNNTSAIPAQYDNAAFRVNIVSYLQSGGNLALFGNAAEILDLAGVTNEMFGNATFNNAYVQNISNTTHPLTYGLPSQLTLSTTSNSFIGSIFTVTDPTMGMTLLGSHHFSSGSWLSDFVEVPYDNGKAVVLGAVSFQYASNDMRTLTGRIIDYLQNSTIGVQMTSPVPGIQNAVFEIQVDVISYSNDAPINNVVNTLTMPSDCVIDYITVDGLTVPSLPAVSLGTMQPNQSKMVVYGIHSTNQGVKDFISSITTQTDYIRALDKMQKHIHLPGAVDSAVALMSNGSITPEILWLKAFLEWSGYSVDLMSPSVVISPGVLDDYNQLIIMNNVSTLPLEYSSTEFQTNLVSYLQSGGNLALFGNAAEILDLAGVTNEMFGNATFNNAYVQNISNTTHPLTYGLPSQLTLSTTSNSFIGSIFTVTDPTMGMTLLGSHHFSSGSWLSDFVEVPYDNGKAVVLGAVSFQYASNDMRTLTGRIIDYLQYRTYLELTAPVVSISVVNNTCELQWEPVSGAQSYSIYSSNVPDGAFELLGSTDETSYNLPLTEIHKFFHVTSSTDTLPVTKMEVNHN